MARPGLEPGTPRFSGSRPGRVLAHARPANAVFLGPLCRGAIPSPSVGLARVWDSAEGSKSRRAEAAPQPPGQVDLPCVRRSGPRLVPCCIELSSSMAAVVGSGSAICSVRRPGLPKLVSAVAEDACDARTGVPCPSPSPGSLDTDAPGNIRAGRIRGLSRRGRYRHESRPCGCCSLDEHEERLALLDDVGGELGGVTAADVPHRVDRFGRDEQDLAGIEGRGLPAVDGVLQRPLAGRR